MNDKKYDPEKVDIFFNGEKLTTENQEPMNLDYLQNDDIECCGCGENDRKKLEYIVITIPYKKVTLKPQTLLCYDCIEKIKKKETKQ